MEEFVNIESSFLLPENLRVLRKRLKWSQEELAEKIGLNRGNIASYENGTAEPKICNLVKLAQLFNLSVFDLTHSNLQADGFYEEATLRYKDGTSQTYLPSVGYFAKEAEDFGHAIRGLHCLFKLKTKDMGELTENMSFAKEQFDQLYGVTEQLLKSHLDLIAIVQQKCTDSKGTDSKDNSLPGK